MNEYYTVATNICGSSVPTVLYVTLVEAYNSEVAPKFLEKILHPWFQQLEMN
jgi:hypothetical protein